ncbi:MAG: NPCBM/NEW2 domain-containing protein [Planctomycetia bacterium]|nr:NPCBM/NEW2 domain-containing protein [Planctomycetia bacterium]
MAALIAVVASGVVAIEATPIFAQASVRNPPAPTYPLTTLDRTAVPAEWLGVDDSGRLDFRTENLGKSNSSTAPVVAADTIVAPEDFISWGTPPELTSGLYIVLIDGTFLAVETVACDSENLQAKIFSLDRTIPLTQVRGIVFQSSGSQAMRDRLFDAVVAPRKGDRDRVFMLTGDETTGTVKSIGYQGVTLETALGPAVVDTTKVAYLTFNPALAAPVPKEHLRMLVGLKSGSWVVSEPVRKGPDGRIRLQPTSIAGDTTWNVSRSEIIYLQTLGGKALYLSTLEPVGYRHVPYLSRSWPYRVDRSATGGNLRVAERRYLQGLGMHSASRISYALDGKSNRFAAAVAIDDETDGRGSVTFRVFVDGEEKYRSPIVRGGNRPLPIEVPIAGGKQLSLVVDFADFADEQDHADWLDARLLP